MNRKKLLILSILGFIFIGGISILGIFAYSYIHPSSQITNRAHNIQNYQAIDSAILLLRNGDIVLRSGADATSYIFTQFNQKDKTYSHCGIVVIEQGYPFIYHSIGGEDNPDQILKRDSASFWFSPVHNLGMAIVRFAFDSMNRASIVEEAKKIYTQKPKFDMQFDLFTDDRMYCAEYIYKVLNKAMKDSNYISASKKFGVLYVATENLFLNPHAHFVCRLRYK
ncbi:MAG: hypothetical protein JST52_00050 [Bacteroidetes bacterium]|nr:hypothetical protein [Bacteroidota bacterium]MBS1739629.1 hypothetical protein [Bacteroidota bacterium]